MIIEEVYLDNLKDDLEQAKQLLKEATSWLAVFPRNDKEMGECGELYKRIDKFLKDE